MGLLGALTLLLSLAGIIATPGVSGAQPPGSGQVKCTGLTGSGTFSPALTAAGSPGGDKFTFKVVSKSCNGSVQGGGAVVTIHGAKLKIQGYWNPTNDCAGLTSDTLGTVTWTYTWVSTPAIAPTVVTSNGGMPWVVVGPKFHFEFPPGTPPPTASAAAGSSFPALTAATMTDNLKTNMPGACSTGWGPYPTANVTNGNFYVAG
jgi:hypothetical protein